MCFMISLIVASQCSEELVIQAGSNYLLLNLREMAVQNELVPGKTSAGGTTGPLGQDCARIDDDLTNTWLH